MLGNMLGTDLQLDEGRRVGAAGQTILDGRDVESLHGVVQLLVDGSGVSRRRRFLGRFCLGC